MRRLATLLLAMILTGCVTQWVTISSVTKSGAYDRLELAYAAGGRDLAVTTRGAVGGVSGLALTHKVAAAMAAAPMPTSTHPTATPDVSARPLYKVVWDFAPGATMMPDDLCQDRPPGAPPRETIQLYVAFCRGTTSLTSAFAESRFVAVDAPGFAEIIGAVTRELFANPQSESDSYFSLRPGWKHAIWR